MAPKRLRNFEQGGCWQVLICTYGEWLDDGREKTFLAHRACCSSHPCVLPGLVVAQRADACSRPRPPPQRHHRMHGRFVEAKTASQRRRSREEILPVHYPPGDPLSHSNAGSFGKKPSWASTRLPQPSRPRMPVDQMPEMEHYRSTHSMLSHPTSREMETRQGVGRRPQPLPREWRIVYLKSLSTVSIGPSRDP